MEIIEKHLNKPWDWERASCNQNGIFIRYFESN